MSLKWAGVIFFNRKGELLLLLRDNIPTIGQPDHWNIVGGVIEEGETPEEAAFREVQEEIGVRLAGVSLFRLYEIDDGRREEPVPYYVYWSRLDRSVAELTLGEGQAMRFFRPEELPALRIIPHEIGILQDFLASPYHNRQGIMTTEPRTDKDIEGTAAASDIVAAIRRSVESGERHWFTAVLEGVGQWPLAEEEVNGRRYRYLIGGEAFDWLLLAERLCEALDDLTPEEEREALLMHGHFPTEVSEETLRRLLGAAKYRAHLNFRYGIQVEEALQLSVAQEVQKERLCRVWENGHIDDDVCSRIYGATRRELFARFQRERELSGDSVSLGDLHEFTYWLFKHRVNNADPARVASDTRKGLAMLSRLQARPR